MGASYTLVGVSGGTYLLGKITGNTHVKETGWLALHAIAHSQIFTFAIKQLTNRERPLTHEGTSGFWNGGNSFPSGHAGSTFAVATVFAYEYRQHLAVPIVAYTIASAVAVSRIGAQRHWLSDIVVGGSSGFLIGRFVYRRHHDPSLPGSPVSATNRLVPQVALSATSVSLAWPF
jgi:membrane-associated phospholipid phosphatase